MRRSRYKTLMTVFILIFLAGALPMPIRAKEAKMPRLIQTVTEQDIYEGLLALGYLRTPVLDASNCSAAYDNVKDCIVRVQMGTAHGSGIIWEMTLEDTVIATNRHVLDYWREENSYVYFPQGHYADADILGVSEQYDVGFLTVDNSLFSYEELEKFRYARVDETIYDGLREGDLMFSVDSGSETVESQYFEALVGDKHRYIEDFDATMLYGRGFAREGMSGGGTFDGRGYLIGMTTGGTYQNETACVPVTDVIKAYEEIVQGAHE